MSDEVAAAPDDVTAFHEAEPAEKVGPEVLGQIVLRMLDEYRGALAESNSGEDQLKAIRPRLDALLAHYDEVHDMVHPDEPAPEPEPEAVSEPAPYAEPAPAPEA